MKSGLLTIFLAALTGWGLQAEGFDESVTRALSVEGRDQGVQELRAAGPEGLAALLKSLSPQIEKVRAGKLTNSERANWDHQRLVIDQVAQQRDAWASGLYWYTDFEEAKRAAAASGKPILSLRLLGKLSDEMSCANSRFFRTTLYSNQQVSRKMRENFILHWQTYMEIPKVTVDFGDGRKLESTVTGNSCHMVLTASGQPVDVIPGLYEAGEFNRRLDFARDLSVKLGTPEGKETFRATHHARLQELQDMLASVPSDLQPKTAVVQGKSDNSDPRITFLAERLYGGLNIGQDSIQVIRAKAPPRAEDAGRLAMSKSRVEDPILAMVNSLSRSIGEDTAHNEYFLHARIHEWFASGSASADHNQLMNRVYAEIFLTPKSDPWMGLRPRNAYTALERDGIVGESLPEPSHQ